MYVYQRNGAFIGRKTGGESQENGTKGRMKDKRRRGRKVKKRFVKQ